MNITPIKNSPFDSRNVVTSLETLTQGTYWNDTSGNTVAYVGMTVLVSGGDDSEKGMYYLTGLPTTESNNWIRVGEDLLNNTSVFDNFVTKSKLEADLKTTKEELAGGEAGSIVTYGEEAGVFSSTVKTENIAEENRTNEKIPTEAAVGTFVENYKPIIITQGSQETTVSSLQLTFWIEE